MTLSPRVRSIMIGCIVALVAIAVLLTFSVPPEVQLGELVRLVIFHGASTWVNMALFTLAGLAGAAYLITRKDGAFRFASAFRYLAVPWWLFNTALGMVSSRLAWNSVNLAEPRLQAAFWIMLAAGIVLAIDFGFGRRAWTAVADIVMAVLIWALILAARNFVHPESPVMASGPEIQIPFFAIVGSLLAAALLAAVLIAATPPAESE